MAIVIDNNFDAFIKQGDSASIALNFYTDTAKTTAKDITDSTVTLTVKENPDDTANLIQKVVTSHTDPTNGKTEIVLSKTDTEINTGKYYWDVQIEFDDNQVHTIIPADSKSMARFNIKLDLS